MGQPNRINNAPMVESDDEDLGRDWLKIHKNVHIDGFRTGLETSQEQTLQSGFNAGFRQALQMSLAAGRLQGAICAWLSYPPKVVSESSSTSCVQGKSLISDGTQIQSLLSSNTDLICSIPSLLKAGIMKTASQPPTADIVQLDRNDSSSDPSHVKTTTQSTELVITSRKSRGCDVVECVTGTSSSTESQATGQTPALSCEHVCHSREHFWSQLEHFKVGAQALGIVPSHDG